MYLQQDEKGEYALHLRERDLRALLHVLWGVRQDLLIQLDKENALKLFDACWGWNKLRKHAWIDARGNGLRVEYNPPRHHHRISIPDLEVDLCEQCKFDKRSCKAQRIHASEYHLTRLVPDAPERDGVVVCWMHEPEEEEDENGA